MALHNREHHFSFTRKAVLMALAGGLSMTACHRQVQAPPAPPPEVATVTVAQQRVELTTELPGRTSPYRMAEIRPQVNGLIQKRLFTEGSDVQAGQVLYQIDPAPFQAALDNAKAALGRAEANLPALQLKADRYKEALADQAVAQQDLDDATAALKQAVADMAYYQAMVETGPHQPWLHTRGLADLRPDWKIGCDGRRHRDGLPTPGPGHDSTTGSDLCGRAPIHHRTAAIAAELGGKADEP